MGSSNSNPIDGFMRSGLPWMLHWESANSDRLTLINRQGQRFDFDKAEAHRLAISLAQFCDDPASRFLVRVRWIDEEKEDHW